LKVPLPVDLFDGSESAVGNGFLSVRRGELHAVRPCPNVAARASPPRGASWGGEAVKKQTISRQDAKAQRRVMLKCFVFFAPSATLRVGVKCFCVYRDFLRALDARATLTRRQEPRPSATRPPSVTGSGSV
jgi:hypothetical protein